MKWIIYLFIYFPLRLRAEYSFVIGEEKGETRGVVFLAFLGFCPWLARCIYIRAIIVLTIETTASQLLYSFCDCGDPPPPEQTTEAAAAAGGLVSKHSGFVQAFIIALPTLVEHTPPRTNTNKTKRKYTLLMYAAANIWKP